MRVGIVMLSTPNIESYAKFPRALWEAYCRRHRLEFKVYRDSLDKSRPPSWSKVLALKEVMAEGWDFAWWVDADSFPVDMGIDVARGLVDLPRDVEMVLCTNGSHLEANTFIVRNSEWCREFLDEVWRRDGELYHAWWEQKAMIDILSERREDAFRVRWAVPDSFHRWDSMNVLHNLANTRDVGARVSSHRGYRPRGIRNDDFVPRYVGGRDYFGLMFSEMGFRSGVEVGVFDGGFSERILGQWRGKLYCVDSWRHLEGYRDVTNLSDEEMEEVFQRTKGKLEAKGAVVMRMSSAEAAARFSDGELDWVYVDADHRRQGVEADLEAWWPKVRKGGVMAGHDYKDDASNLLAEFGVKGAVDRFFERRGLAVWETGEWDWRSWYVLRR